MRKKYLTIPLDFLAIFYLKNLWTTHYYSRGHGILWGFPTYRIYCNKRPGAMHFSKGGATITDK